MMRHVPGPMSGRAIADLKSGPASTNGAEPARKGNIWTYETTELNSHLQVTRLAISNSSFRALRPHIYSVRAFAKLID
jgi:hypothetical protein